MTQTLCDKCGEEIDRSDKQPQVLIDFADGANSRKGQVFDVCASCASDGLGVMMTWRGKKKES